jgi:uncharacterized membrane protein YuzA (DUF378 family)
MTEKYDMNTILLTVAITLVIVGALNWGLTAFNYNLVEMVAGKDTTFSKAVYYLVAISGLAVTYALVTKKMKVKC